MDPKNELQFEKSPYLLQHADNPVRWRPWGQAAFEAARREDRESVLGSGEALTELLRAEPAQDPGKPGRELVKAAAAQLSKLFDPDWGGFGHAPKFPTPHNLLFLLGYAHRTGSKAARDMAERTLEHMYRGGIFDHIGGGFCRYSTDEKWLVPHFEKMLYDNALLILTYTEAFHHTRRPVFRETACRTLDYVLRQLADPLGGFWCAQDADSDGVEGKYYLLTPQDVHVALCPDTARRFCERFNVTSRGNFMGKSIPNLINATDWETEPAWEKSAREGLCAFRRKRTKLSADDKVLTAWNGLMLAALARAGLLLEEPEYLAAGARTVSFLREHLTEKNGGLLARWREGSAAMAGKLDDYAFVAWGLLEMYGATFQTKHLSAACRLTEKLLDDFFDEARGGFYPYSREGEQLITRRKESYDGAVPSGNAVAGLVLSRLWRLTGKERFRTAGEAQLRYLTGAVRSYPAGHCFALLVMLEELWPSAELICAAKGVPAELYAFLRRKPRENLAVLVKTAENAEELSGIAPFTAEIPIPESGARYYLCRGGACQRPVDSPEAVEEQMGAKA